MHLKQPADGEKPLLQSRVSQEITAMEFQKLLIEQRLAWLREYGHILEQKGMAEVHG